MASSSHTGSGHADAALGPHRLIAVGHCYTSAIWLQDEVNGTDILHSLHDTDKEKTNPLTALNAQGVKDHLRLSEADNSLDFFRMV